MIGSPPAPVAGFEQAPKANPGMAIWKGITSLFPGRLAGFQIIIPRACAGLPAGVSRGFGLAFGTEGG